MKAVLKSEVAREMTFDKIHYSKVWEDQGILEDGLAVQPGDDVLSITSAGDNVLALLLREPRSVTAIDVSPCQSAMLELKIAALRKLSHAEFACLMGVRGGYDRLDLYERIRRDLPERAVGFWDGNNDVLEAGMIHCGRLERFFSVFQERYLHPLISQGILATLFETRSMDAQTAFFLELFDTPAFRECVRSYFSREMIEAHGRDPAQFRYVNNDQVAGYFLMRFFDACTRLPLWTNFYIEFLLTSHYADLERGPAYLRPSNFARLRRLVDRVRVVTDELEGFVSSQPVGTFNKGNFSDIFEYMSEDHASEVFRLLASVFRPGGRLAYWNLLVPRCRPDHLASQLRPLRELADRLEAQDRACFHRAFHVEEVLPS